MLTDEKITTFLDQYKLKQAVYRDFANTIKFILETLLNNNGLHYHVVSAREKNNESLEKKLRDDSKLKYIHDLREIDDLAGCRIIFYLDSDIQRFVKYIYEEFSVIKNIPKYSPDDYNALHLVVHLNEDRLKLTEYCKFEELRCEIQLTTVLYHAWSEMAHDIIYKSKKELLDFDQPAFEYLKKQFEDTMKAHIKQASYNFEFIHKQFENLKQGKKVFNIDFLKGIAQSNSNNEIYENLALLHQYIQEFGDKTPNEIDIIGLIKNTLERTSAINPQAIKTVIGDFEGNSHSDIASVCLDLLNELKYPHIEKVFDLLIKLSNDLNHKVKTKAIEVLEKLSSYNFHVLKKVGFYPHLFVADEIGKWDDKKAVENLEPLLTITHELLQPSFEGASMTDDKTVTFHYGPLPVNDKLKEIRKQIIGLLKKVYSISPDLTHKQRILQIMQEATKTPIRGNYGDDMEEMVHGDTASLIDYYIGIIPTADNEIIKDIEEQTHWFIRRFGTEKLPKIEQLQSIIASNKEYEIFRIFVGYHFDDDLNMEEAEKIRLDKIQRFIESIADNNYEEWQKRILFIRKNYSTNEIGEFRCYNIFLFELGKQKPEIALKLIQENEKELEPFLIHLIGGIWKSRLTKTAKSIISKWIEQNKHLSVCAGIFEYIEDVDISLLTEIFKKASEGQDTIALNNIINSIIKNYPKYNGLQSLFVETIKELTKHNDYRWFHNVWYKKESFLKALSEKDFDVILDNLLKLPNIEHHAEEVLIQITEKYPQKVVSFFKNRVTIQAHKKKGEQYDAIPFSFYRINKSLQKHAAIVVEETLKWFSEKERLLQWEGSDFLQKVFPSFDAELERELIKLIKSGIDKNAKIVISILRAYRGEQFLHKVCKKFIKQYPKNEKYRQEIFIILSQTGVVSGEYGFVEAYKQKKQEVKDWKNDKSSAIKTFAKKYEDYLDKQITYEQKQADEDVALRKREFSLNPA